MRILQIITKQQRRGAEIFACQLATFLQEKGHVVKVISVFDGTGELPFKGGIKSIEADFKKRFLDWKSWRKLADFIREFDPDIIQANASETLKFVVLSKLVMGWNKPIVYRNANQVSGFIRHSFQRKWNKFLFNHVSGVVSVSEASKNDFVQTFQFKSRPIEVIPIGLDSLEIDSRINHDPIQKLPKSFLIQIGGWVSEKDPLGMIQIFKKLIEDQVNLHLVFMGSGPLEVAMKERIQQLDLSQRIHLIPNQKNIFPTLTKAKALVMPSKIEGLPAVILEGMYLKIPVIAYGVGGIPEVLKNGETGWCVPPNDQNGFVSALEEVLTIDTDSKEAILSNAHELVISDYTIEKVTLQFEDFYKRLLDSPIK